MLAGQHQLGPAGSGGDDSVSQAELLSLLRTHYNDGDSPKTHGFSKDTIADSAASMPKSDYRSPSPHDPTIPIPPVLLELASSAVPAELTAATTITFPAPSFDHPLPEDYGERGEMGGKRRKKPHERAGWKEMEEEQPPTKRRAAGGGGGGRRKNESAGGETGEETQGAGMFADPVQDQGSIAGLGGGSEADMVGGYGNGMGISFATVPAEGTSVSHSPNQHANAALDHNGGQRAGQVEEGRADEGRESTKQSRAAQNRRAQQLFRRRREEHMKKLEADSAALLPTRQALMTAESRLKDMAMLLEASKIETAALQSALKTVSQSSGTSILTPTNNLIIRAGSLPRATPDTMENIDAAFGVLMRQSRELAKQNRERRGGG